jgi:hypothetical protein
MHMHVKSQVVISLKKSRDEVVIKSLHCLFPVVPSWYRIHGGVALHDICLAKLAKLMRRTIHVPILYCSPNINNLHRVTTDDHKYALLPLTLRPLMCTFRPDQIYHFCKA